MAFLVATPATADALKLNQADYDTAEGCLGALDGVTATLVTLAPEMQHPADVVQTVFSNKQLSGQIAGALREIETAQPNLHKLEAGAAYVTAKRPWDDLKSQPITAQFAYWKTNGATSDACQSMILRVVAIAGLMGTGP